MRSANNSNNSSNNGGGDDHVFVDEFLRDLLQIFDPRHPRAITASNNNTGTDNNNTGTDNNNNDIPNAGGGGGGGDAIATATATTVRCSRCQKNIRRIGTGGGGGSSQQPNNSNGRDENSGVGEQYCTCGQQQQPQPQGQPQQQLASSTTTTTTTTTASSPSSCSCDGRGRNCSLFGNDDARCCNSICIKGRNSRGRNGSRRNGLLGFLFGGGSSTRNNANNNTNDCLPPCHPEQSFHRLCVRIGDNDPTLTCVDLRDEFLNIKKLSTALSRNSNLRHLHLQRTIRERETQDSRPRSAPAHDVLNLCMDGLRYNQGLVSLDLSQTCIRASGALFVSRGLRDHPTLQKLRLDRCILQDEGIRRLGGAPLGRRLLELDLSHNALSDGTALLQILLMNPSLESLNLQVNNLGPASIESFLQHGFLSLKSLNLSRNQICWDGPTNVLGRALGATASALTTAADADADAAGATSNSNVIEDSTKSGDVKENTINGLMANNVDDDDDAMKNQERGVKPISIDTLLPPIFCQLEELRLDSNMLTSSVAESIADGLMTNTSLRKLDLSQNYIGNKGAAALALSISTNAHCKLRDLSLGTNKIACKGALALLLFACSSSTSSNSTRRDHTQTRQDAIKTHAIVQNPSSPPPSDDTKDSSGPSNTANYIEQSENGLTRLDLSNNMISDGQAISNALQFAGAYNDSPSYDGENDNNGDSIQNMMKELKKKATKNLFEWKGATTETQNTAKDLLDPRRPSSLRYFNIHRNPILLKYKQEIRFWTRLNASGGRRLLSIAGDGPCRGDILARWADVLGDVSDDPDGLFFFLVRKPELCLLASSTASEMAS